jgi:spore coat protein U-like protein
MMRKLAPMLLLILALGPQKAAAQACSLTISALNFGTYSGSALNGAATGTVVCSGGWNIPMYAGTGEGATEAIRYMTGPGGAKLSYKLFTDSARINNWGDTTNSEASGTGNATVIVYGHITLGQTLAVGTYTDTMSTATTTFLVTAVIATSCTISASNLSFGTYIGALLNANSAITVNCTNLGPFNIGLSAGNGSSATVTARKMTGPGSGMLKYSMFRDSGRTLNWGYTVGSDTLQATGTGSAVQYTVYGQIPGGQSTRVGAYTDTIVASVTY